MGDYYTGQIHLVKSHYEFTILTILQGEFDQCSSHPFHLYQKIENGKNRYVEAQSASWSRVQQTDLYHRFRLGQTELLSPTCKITTGSL